MSTTNWILAGVVAYVLLKPKDGDAVNGIGGKKERNMGLKILKELEDFREKNLHKEQPTDWTIRVCEAIVAAETGLPKNRAQWTRLLYPEDYAEIGKPSIRYEFEDNKELKDFVQNECKAKGKTDKGGRKDYEFSLNGY